ncbi:MAG: hypothetical protein ABFS14_04580 [Gemmatimonadota bacterium]
MANDDRTSSLDAARDELFSHIRRCGVLEADETQRSEWMTDTVQYLSERYPDLTDVDLGQLGDIGQRYCQPAIPHGPVESGGPNNPESDEVNAA